MKGKRLKKYRKLVQKFSLTFGFRPPYQVLVDAEMIQDSEASKMDLVSGLERTLGDKVKPMITQCCIRHLYTRDLPQSRKDTIIPIAKGMERRRCNHHTLDEPLTTLECFKDVIDPKKSLSNSNHYVVASQDVEVRRYCRGLKGVPLIFVKRSVMVMEPMVGDSLLQREGMERSKFRNGLKTRATGVLGKRKHAETEDDNVVAPGEQEAYVNGEHSHVKKKKSRGPKEPNSLSVRKPKKAIKDTHQNEGTHEKSAEAPSMPVLNEASAVQEDIAVADTASPSGGAQDHPTKRQRRRKHKPRAPQKSAATIANEDDAT